MTVIWASLIVNKIVETVKIPTEAKTLKSCLPLLLNRITVSVRCVSSMIVVLNAKLA